MCMMYQSSHITAGVGSCITYLEKTSDFAQFADVTTVNIASLPIP